MIPEVLSRETRSSIELTRNARGDYQWVVKKYVEDGQETDGLSVIKSIDAALRADYIPDPAPSEPAGLRAVK